MASSAPPAPPSPAGALSDRIVNVIRRAILRGMMVPGQHLTQTGLAEDYAISKVPVREALKQLHAEGLLQHDRNRGYFVAKLPRSEAVELYRIRRWLESELLRSARWPTGAELRRLRGYFEVISRPVNSANREERLEALGDARAMMFGLSPHKTLLREAMRLWTLTDRFRALLPGDASVTGEKAMHDALAMQDRDALLAAHAADRDRIEALLEKTFDLMPGHWSAD
ncbi:MAG: GntR family transcriptional regulator [Sphingobium sp.]